MLNSGWAGRCRGKTPESLYALRAKKLAAEMKDPEGRTRKEHDLDWSLKECQGYGQIKS